MISRLHYITQDHPSLSHQNLALEAMKGGVRWIQVRIKNRQKSEVKNIAAEIFAAAQHFGAKVILNDHVELAFDLGLDGVHVGKQDMDPTLVRKIIGSGKMLGGTANTWEDIQKLNKAGVDYIGLGPYRFTTTKDQLSPVLGLDRYTELADFCKRDNYQVPMIAIGGIQLTDIAPLRKAGIYGVAVAGAINMDTNPSNTAAKFVLETNKDLITHEVK